MVKREPNVLSIFLTCIGIFRSLKKSLTLPLISTCNRRTTNVEDRALEPHQYHPSKQDWGFYCITDSSVEDIIIGAIRDPTFV